MRGRPTLGVRAAAPVRTAAATRRALRLPGVGGRGRLGSGRPRCRHRRLRAVAGPDPTCRSGVRAAARNRPALRTSNSQQAMPRAVEAYTAGAAGMAVRGAFRAGRGGFRAVRATERRRVGCERPSTGSGWWLGAAPRSCTTLLVVFSI